MKLFALGLLALVLLSVPATPALAGDPAVAASAGPQYTLAMQGMT